MCFDASSNSENFSSFFISWLYLDLFFVRLSTKVTYPFKDIIKAHFFVLSKFFMIIERGVSISQTTPRVKNLQIRFCASPPLIKDVAANIAFPQTFTRRLAYAIINLTISIRVRFIISTTLFCWDMSGIVKCLTILFALYNSYTDLTDFTLTVSFYYIFSCCLSLNLHNKA